jgi:hypothetical protein
MIAEEAFHRIGMQNAGYWNPARGDRFETIPRHHTPLTATTHHKPPQYTLTGQQNSPPLRQRDGWTYRRQISVVAVRFDSKDFSHYKVPSMTTDRVVVGTLLAELTLRQLQCGRLGRPSFLGNAPALIDSSWESRANSGESFSLGSGVSISSGNWGVAVTVAVHCLTLTTFQAFTGVPLCAH